MKTKIYNLLGLLMILFSSLTSWAQDEFQTNSAIPYQTGNSFRYGTDVTLDNQATQDQRGTCLSVAFNGWIYAGFIISEGTNQSWKVWMSQDDGISWTLLINQPISMDWYTVALDLIVCGTSTADLSVYIPRIYQNDVTGTSILRVSRYDANTGAFISTLRDNSVPTSDQRFLDVAIASDYKQPAIGASPYSIVVLYSKRASAKDSIILLTSSDGGYTIDGEKTVTATLGYVRNVSLAYGIGQYYNRGRYFAAWEEHASTVDDLGTIWTAHSEPYFYSDFSTPYRLDNLFSHTAGYCRNPSIACQFNTVNNSMGDLTEVVLFDRAYDGNTATFNVVGAYNLEAPVNDNWSIFGMDASLAHCDIQPDIHFDPGYNNFLATYCNLTGQKLRYLVKYQDMNDPYNWGVIIDKYNDANNLADPYPQVEINPVHYQVAHVWTAEGISGNGVAMFDSEYSTMGTPPASVSTTFCNSVYPNPARNSVNFSIGLLKPAKIKVTLYSPVGQNRAVIYEGDSPAGTSIYPADVSMYAAGTYFYEIMVGNETAAGRLVIIR
jgi:hypothetical protein